MRKTRPCRVTRRYSISIDEYIASSVANQIASFAIVYLYTVYQCKELFADLMLICTHKCQDMRNDDVHEIRLVFTHEVKNIKGKNTE